MLLFVSSIGCSVILIAGNWAFLLLPCSWLVLTREHFWKTSNQNDDGIKFFGPNDAGLRALTVVLWENPVLVFVVILVLESKAP